MNKDITAEQLFYLGMEHYDKGDLKKAQDFLQEADNKSPGRLSILVNLITIMHQQNKWDESLNTCERLLELFPNESSSWEKFANYLFGLSQYNESIEF